MLERLDNINWGSLEDANGPANDLPGLVRALVSSEPELQEEALEQIWDRIWHHGRVTEATPYVIPFLIELVESGALGENLSSVLELLYYMGDGPTPWAREIINLKTYCEKAESESLVLLERENDLSAEAIDAIFERAETYIQQSHIAVREGLPVYLHLLETTDDPLIREIATWLTVIFPENVLEIAPRLRQLIDQESDITVKATMIWSLGRLTSDLVDQQDLSFFSRLAHSREHPLIYFYAAAAYASIAKRDTPLEIAALVATGIYWDWHPRNSPPLPTPGPILDSSSIQVHGCRALSKMEVDKAVPLLIEVLDRIDPLEANGTYYSFKRVVDSLLDLAFGARAISNAYRVRGWFKDGKWISVNGRHFESEAQHQPISIQELTDLQRQVLAGLIAAEKLWAYEDNVYALYGLPITREALRELLAAKLPSP